METTIDLDMIEHHEFVIKPSFDEGLARKSSLMFVLMFDHSLPCAELRSEMEEAESKANAILRKVSVCWRGRSCDDSRCTDRWRMS